MLIKSQMLLPRNEEEETPLKKLQMAVMEYAKAKNAAEFLRNRWESSSGSITREPQEPERGQPLHYEISVLEKAFRRMLARSNMMKELQRRPEQTLENLLKNKVTPIPVKVIAVMRYLYKYGETDFVRRKSWGTVGKIILNPIYFTEVCSVLSKDGLSQKPETYRQKTDPFRIRVGFSCSYINRDSLQHVRKVCILQYFFCLFQPYIRDVFFIGRTRSASE